jgi:oligopeptidase B
MTQDRLSPPVAKQVPTERTHHGDTVVDPYEWLRAKDDPEVLAYLEAENAYAEQETAHLDGLRKSIFDEIKSRTLETDLSVPTRHGAWWYYSRTLEGKQYALHCRCPIADDADWTPPTLEPGVDVDGEQVLLDGNAEAEGHDFFSLGTFDVSVDGDLLAYATDTVGDERYTLRFKDLGSGELLPDEVPNTFYGGTWSLDGSTFFYVTVDDTWRPYRVWRHRLGTSASEDEIVYEESDDRFWVGVGMTRSRKYLVVSAGSKITTEVRVLEADQPDGEWRVVAPRRTGVEYSLEHAVVAGDDRFLILHNDGVENFTLAEAPVDDPGPEQWRTVIEHRADTRLEGIDAFADHLVLGYRREALSRLAVIALTDGGYAEPREIEFDEELFACGPAGNPEWDQPLFRLAYTSFVTPATVYDLDVATGKLALRKQQPVLGGYDAADYEQHREWATASDGTQVPISVVCRRGTPRDGSAPAMIYGYGSYETSIDPSFSVSRLSLLDRGMVFAVAHIRGGGEMGRAWYENGKTLTKVNTFTDFVAAARHLSEQRWTSSDRLIAYGGSAGGLLVGAAVNLAPDAFAGVLAVVPFVDALTSILDPSLPLTVIEWDEWGDPLHDPEVYAYMKGYTPYENVAATAYPPILAMTSLHDTRVLYVEPAKWVARLRTTTTDNSTVVLKTEMSAGHGGVSGRYEAWKETAYLYAWALDVAGAPHDLLPRPDATESPSEVVT